MIQLHLLQTKHSRRPTAAKAWFDAMRAAVDNARGFKVKTMTREQAQEFAPSYLRLPDDGLPYRCDKCKKLFPHDQVFKIFTPDEKVHFAQCEDCITKEWLNEAKDCGMATDS